MMSSNILWSHFVTPEGPIMSPEYHPGRTAIQSITAKLLSLSLALGLVSVAACAPAISTAVSSSNNMSPGEPIPDPRVGLRAGKFDAATAAWNLRLVSTTQPTEKFMGVTNSDLAFLGNVQTCRGSHTHTVVVDPKDPDNVYVYISGSAGVRSPSELAGCVRQAPDKDPNSALFRIEVIKVPLAHPEQAAIVSSPRIF